MNIRYNKKLYTVYLCDEGTLDTVIEVNGHRHYFDNEYASECRNKTTGEMTKKGLRELAIEVLDSEID